MGTQQTFGRRLVALIEAKWPGRGGRRQAADAFGVRESQLSKYVHDVTMPESAKLARMAEVLGVQVNELLGIPPTAQKPMPQPTDGEAGYRLPKIGRTAAGMAGIDPKAEPDDWLPLHKLYRGDVWAVEVCGDSMIDANICNGDHVVVRRQPVAVEGEVVLAWVGDSHDGGFTLKKLTRRTNRKTGRTYLALVPRNAALAGEEIPLDGSVPHQIFGVYLGLIRQADEEGVVKKRKGRRKMS